MRVLLIGSSSFAAQGLPQWLERAGHEAWTFGRGPRSDSKGRRLKDSLANLKDLTGVLPECDALVNYLLLKEEGPEANVEFCQRLAGLATALCVSHFIHISSLSVVPARASLITEGT